MDENQIIERRLPPELLAEIHKCLPLADAINVLVNVPTRAIYQNNSPRMHRIIQRIKTSLNEYIGTFVNVQKDNNRKALIVYNEIEWTPQFYALLRYGSLTSLRQFWMRFGSIVGIPENFMEQLLLHLANSRFPKMMLHSAEMGFEIAPLPMPSFLKQLFKEKKQYQSDGRILFESVDLKAENGQILCIFEAELNKIIRFGDYQLRMLVMNKMDRNNCFQIIMTLNSTKKFIQCLEFTQWHLDEIDIIDKVDWSNQHQLKQIGDKLEAKKNIMWNSDLDMFLRRGAGYTHLRHFKINQNYLDPFPDDYVNFLIDYISSTKYPEQFLESIDIRFKSSCRSSFIDKICQSVIPKGGKFLHVGDNKKLHILSAKTSIKLEFTLANGTTNGEYVFDVAVEFAKGNGTEKIAGIKIQKRKINNIIVGMKCNDQIGKGKKRKVANEEEEEDGPKYSGKIMKK